MTELDIETIKMLTDIIHKDGCGTLRTSLGCMHRCPIKRSFHNGVRECAKLSKESAINYLRKNYTEEQLFEVLL